MASDQEIRLIIKAIKEGKGIEEIVSGLDSVSKKGKETNSTMDGLKKAFSGLLPALGAAAVVAAIKKMSDSAMEYALAVDSVKDITGASAEQSSKWVVQANYVGASTEAVANGMAILAKNMVANQTIFERHGVAIKDNNGQLLSLEQVLANVRTRANEVGNGARKTALEMELMGRSGKELDDFLTATNEEMEGVANQAAEMGLIMDEVTVNSIEQQKREMNNLTMVNQSLGKEINKTLIPSLNFLGQIAIWVAKQFNNLVSFSEKAGSVIARFFGGTQQLTRELEVLRQMLQKGVLTQEQYNKKVEEAHKYWSGYSTDVGAVGKKIEGFSADTKNATKFVVDLGKGLENTGKKGETTGEKLSKSAKEVKDDWRNTADSVQSAFERPFDALKKQAENTAQAVGASFAKTFAGDAVNISGLAGAIGGVFGFIGGSVVSGFLSLFTNQKSYAEIVEERFKQMSKNANKAIDAIGKEKTLAQKRLDVLGALSVGAGGTYEQGQITGELGIAGMTEAEAKKKLLQELLIQEEKELALRKKSIPTLEAENVARQKTIDDIDAAILRKDINGKMVYKGVEYWGITGLAQLMALKASEQADIDAAKKMIANYDKATEYDIIKAILETRTALGIPAMASGGIVTRPTLAVVGEKGPEAVVPLSKAGGAAGVMSNITIQVGAFMGTEADAIEFAKYLQYYQNKIAKRNLTV